MEAAPPTQKKQCKPQSCPKLYVPEALYPLELADPHTGRQELNDNNGGEGIQRG